MTSARPITATRARAWASSRIAFWGALLLLTVAGGVGRALLAPDYVAFLDGLNFVRALDDYDVLRERPHWPGYPVYVWAGRAVTALVGDGVRALHLLSALATAACALPLALLTTELGRGPGGRERAGPVGGERARAAGLLAAALWLAIPISWIDGTEIFSDPLALLLALGALLACIRAARAARPAALLALGGALFGLAVGVRLSYAPLAAALPLAAWLAARGEGERGGWARARRALPPALLSFAALAAVVGAWLGWQVVTQGSAFVQAAAAHLQGHFGSWGGSVATDAAPGNRPLRFAALAARDALGLAGAGAPLWRVAPSVAWLALLAAGVRWLVAAPRAAALLLAWGAPYALWVLTSHDVELVRYAFPLAALACAVAGLAAVRVRAAGLASALAVATVLLTLAVSLPLARAHATEAPVAVQTARWLAGAPDGDRVVLLVPTPAAGAPVGLHPLEFRWLEVALREEGARTALLPLHGGSWRAQARALAARGRTPYLLAPPDVAPPDDAFGPAWVPAAAFCRTPGLRAREPGALRLYRFGPAAGGAASVAPDCRGAGGGDR